MAIKLVAIDLDDTLLGTDLKISDGAVRSIRELRERGIWITLATGRMFRSARPYALELGMDVPLITYQGALVKNAVSDQVLFHRPVPEPWGHAVGEAAREAGCFYQAYFDDNLYMERLTSEGEAYANMAGVTPVIEPDLLGRIKEQEPTKLLIINNDIPQLQQMEMQMRRSFGDRLYITRSKPYYLEFMNTEATKGRALKVVSEYFGVDRLEVMAIGDSFNDIEMLKFAGLAVVMGNAPQKVKRYADYVTESNDEDGVAMAIQRLVLENGV